MVKRDPMRGDPIYDFIWKNYFTGYWKNKIMSRKKILSLRKQLNKLKKLQKKKKTRKGGSYTIKLPIFQ